jgi:hypothetical protein
MRSVLAALSLMAILPLTASPASAQDFIRDNMFRGLKDLREVSIVVRPVIELEVLGVREWGDLLEVALARDIPSLRVSESTATPDWLELGVTTAAGASVITLTVYRWATLTQTSDRVFVGVWQDRRVITGRPPRGMLEEELRRLVTRLAADYVRAHR